MAPRRILLVEDDLDTAELFAGLLCDAGYDVERAADGVEALVQLEFRPAPDLILLDLWLPVVTGIEVIEHVLEEPALAAVPIVVVTAAPVPREVAAQVSAVVAKPFDLDRLLGTLEQALARPRVTGREEELPAAVR
jgi:CheY-like chemotaxis protein